jgi:hypothetical protein
MTAHLTGGLILLAFSSSAAAVVAAALLLKLREVDETRKVKSCGSSCDAQSLAMTL